MQAPRNNPFFKFSDLFSVFQGNSVLTNQIYSANMAKNVGVKPGRPNPFGLPDLIKPDGWIGPSHSGNHGDVPLAIGE